MSAELSIKPLLDTPTIALRDIVCRGDCRHKSPEECAQSTCVVFPYRGAYVRHLGSDAAVAEPNQVLFFNKGESYRISHPVDGGDACLSLAIDEQCMGELVPRERLHARDAPVFRSQRLRIDPCTQALVARLRYGLQSGVMETLEAETVMLTLVKRAVGTQTSHAAKGSAGRKKLVDRAKLVLTSDLSRRWTLAQIAAEVGVSPVYLTQAFQQVEGMPLYRYQLLLRLARALDLLPQYADLTALGIELGFSSHSHFSAAFRQAYRCTPNDLRRLGRARPAPVQG